MTKVSVLGGSTPFTVILIDELTERLKREQIKGALCIHGRDKRSLQALTTYAEPRLKEVGWTAYCTTDVISAVRESGVIVQQIRFGGLEQRAWEESLAARYGCFADETLGIGGLTSALIQADALRKLGRLIAKHQGEASVLNLTNPLSVTTSILSGEGVNPVYGLCELPIETVRTIAIAIDADSRAMKFRYSGFNHRGFIHDLADERGPCWERLMAVCSTGQVAGFDRATIGELGAVPLKYFRRLIDPPRQEVSRASVVMDIRARARSELLCNPSQRPHSLARRQSPWYAKAVVPAILGLIAKRPIEMTLNCVDKDGITRERRATIQGGAVTQHFDEVATQVVGKWVSSFERVERATLAAVRSPSRKTIEAALRVDPSIRISEVSAPAEEILGKLGPALNGGGL